jgi:hypothetical protein
MKQRERVRLCSRQLVWELEVRLQLKHGPDDFRRSWSDVWQISRDRGGEAALGTKTVRRLIGMLRGISNISKSSSRRQQYQR